MHEIKERGDYSGAELKCIRHTLEQTREEFGEDLGMTAEQIKQYEERDLKFCNLCANIQPLWEVLKKYCLSRHKPETYKFLMVLPLEEA